LKKYFIFGAVSFWGFTGILVSFWEYFNLLDDIGVLRISYRGLLP
jgi:hypothetical protein